MPIAMKEMASHSCFYPAALLSYEIQLDRQVEEMGGLPRY